jgi:hypothetical protein
MFFSSGERAEMTLFVTRCVNSSSLKPDGGRGAGDAEGAADDEEVAREERYMALFLPI